MNNVFRLALVSAVFFCFGFSTVAGQGNNSQDNRKPYKEGELLVKFKPGTPEEVKMEVHKKIGSGVVKEFRSINVQQVRLKEGLSVEEAIRLYKSDPNVEYAEPDYEVKTQK